MDRAYNLLVEPLIRTVPSGVLTLPGVLAALARDEVESFPALRPHQGMFWHMFLVQLAALALHRAGRTDLPDDEASWAALLRGLTADFADDEPWCLVVDDWGKPAFMQPPVPQRIREIWWEKEEDSTVASPDALDFLDAAKNHDIKRSIARDCSKDDWVFSLVSVQTGGTHSVQYFGASRTGNIYAPRLCMGLAPLPPEGTISQAPRLGSWFAHDTEALLETRESELSNSGLLARGLGLIWLAEWPEGTQLQINELDIWFIDICRRLRLVERGHRLISLKAVSKPNRINSKVAVFRDPWTPLHKTKEGKAYALSEGGFNYKELTKIMLGENDKKGQFSHNWILPSLMKPSSQDLLGQPLLLVTQGIAAHTKKSGTLGMFSRALPISGKISRALWSAGKREDLHKLAQDQIKIISDFENVLVRALWCYSSGGEAVPRGEGEKREYWSRLRKKYEKFAKYANTHLDRFADALFFEHLWRRYDAQAVGQAALETETVTFASELWKRTQDIFESALPTMRCPSLYRHRAEARARAMLNRMVRKNYPEVFENQMQQEEGHAA